MKQSKPAPPRFSTRSDRSPDSHGSYRGDGEWSVRLAAAAPDLLDALKAALPFVACVFKEHGRNYLPNSGDVQDRIQELLAKIEGDR